MPKKKPKFKKILDYSVTIAWFLILLFCLTTKTPALAQQPTLELPDFYFNDTPLLSPFQLAKDSAFVILDGRKLFAVGSFNDKKNYVSASRRAAEISKRIEEAAESEINPKLEVRKNNGLLIIYLNDNYLFTVTNEEITNSETPGRKAIELTNKIEESIVQAQQERTQEYKIRQYSIAFLILVTTIAINRFLLLLKHYSAKQALFLTIPFFKNKFLAQKKKANFILKIKLNAAKIITGLVGIYLITDFFPITRQLRYEIVRRFWTALNSPLFSLGNNKYSIVSILILIGLFWGLLYLIGTLTSILRSSILHRTGMSRGSQEVIFIITKYFLLAIGTIILLQIWGLNLSSLTILGSALGVGIGFGFQDIAKNFASGLVLLFERSVQVGDFIEVNNYKGTVEKVGARSIVLTTLDRVSIIVPNSNLLADEVVNWTYKNSISRLHIPVGVAYGSDTEIVKTVLIKAAEEHFKVLSTPTPQVFFDGFGDSSLNFELLVWISEPSHQAFIKSDLYFKVEKLLNKHNIEIPFPQRDIAIRNSNLSFALPEDIETALLQWLKKDKNQ